MTAAVVSIGVLVIVGLAWINGRNCQRYYAALYRGQLSDRKRIEALGVEVASLRGGGDFLGEKLAEALDNIDRLERWASRPVR